MPTPAELEDAGIQSFDQDIRRMTHDELVQHFGSSTGRIVLARVFRNLWWQTFEGIRDYRQPSIRGNLRTSYYRLAMPVLRNMKDAAEGLATDPYDRLGGVLAEMVLERHFLSYTDLGIVDENWENRRIGTTRPEVLVFAEKAGWILWLRDVHQTWGTTTLALGGAPSAITSCYTAEHLRAVLPDPPPSLQLIGVVDYDPAGHDIALAFQHQLAQAGFPDSSLDTVGHPRHYTDDQLDMFAYDLSPRRRSHNARWLADTGGVRGQAMGLESESMPPETLWEEVRRLIEDGPRNPRSPDGDRAPGGDDPGREGPSRGDSEA